MNLEKARHLNLGSARILRVGEAVSDSRTLSGRGKGSRKFVVAKRDDQDAASVRSPVGFSQWI
jgi:hypothetical protein